MNHQEMFSKGTDLFLQQDYNQAAEVFEQLLRANDLPLDTRIYSTGSLGLCYKHKGDYSKALDLLEKAESASNQCDVASGDMLAVFADALADCYVQVIERANSAGDFELSSGLLKKLKSLIVCYGNSQKFRVVHHKGLFLIQSAFIQTNSDGDFDGALKSLLTVIEEPYASYFLNDNDTVFLIGLVHLNIGRIFLETGQFERAIPHLEQSLELFSTHDGNAQEIANVKKSLRAARIGTNPPEVIRSGLQAIRLGNMKEIYEALNFFRDKDPSILPVIRPVIVEAMVNGDGGTQIFGATTLASLGHQASGLFDTLTSFIDPHSDDPDQVVAHYAALEGLSYLRNEPRATELLIKDIQYQSNIGLRNGAMFALGALGSEKAREALKFLSGKGERAAIVSLTLFGRARFRTINEAFAKGTKPYRCTSCTFEGAVNKPILGKLKCPECQESDSLEAL